MTLILALAPHLNVLHEVLPHQVLKETSSYEQASEAPVKVGYGPVGLAMHEKCLQPTPSSPLSWLKMARTSILKEKNVERINLEGVNNRRNGKQNSKQMSSSLIWLMCSFNFQK